MSGRFSPAISHEAPPIAGYAELPELKKPWIEGYITLGSRSVPKVSTRLGIGDRMGWFRMRLGLGRGSYRVLPGLYAAGSPDPASPVFVSANYKMSFDALRRELTGLDAWILVLDTQGINVWCAAGKGSFGTAELLSKLTRTRLAEVVSHNVLVLPQLAATGVSAPELSRRGRFRVVWGPVLAKDIRAFLASGMKKSDSMRAVPFGLRERMAVSTVEFTQASPAFAGAFLLALAYALPVDTLWAGRFAGILAFSWGALLVACFAFPALLPYLPFKAFALKGAVLGLAWSLGLALSLHPPLLGGAGLVLAGSAAVAFVAMGFTGASTFTSQRGAALEVERGLPLMIGSLALGLGLGAASRIFGI